MVMSLILKLANSKFPWMETMSLHLMAIQVQEVGLQIQVMKNNNDILRFSTGDDEHFENLSNTWTLSLKAGDIIKLSVRNGALFTSSNHFRTFTGKLL